MATADFRCPYVRAGRCLYGQSMVPITVNALTLHDITLATSPNLTWQPVAGGPAIPRAPGVYVWIAQGTDAVLYIGRASGAGGLRTRLTRETTWKTANDVIGHSRTVNAYSADPHYAVTPTGDEAKTWERNLLHLHLHETGLVPVIHGGAWWNRSTPHEDSRTWVQHHGHPRLAATAPTPPGGQQ